MPSKLDLTLEHSKPIYTSEPLGCWAKLIAFLPSPAELYIVFEQVHIRYLTHSRNTKINLMHSGRSV